MSKVLVSEPVTCDFAVYPAWHSTDTMCCAEFNGRTSIHINNNHNRPLLTNHNDVVIRVICTSISGSDLNLYYNAVDGLCKGDILGHEAVGIVTEAASSVNTIKVGDRVCVSSVIACGHCWFCKEGKYSCCDCSNPSTEQQKLYGHRTAGFLGSSRLFGGYPGSHAEYVRVPNADLNCFVLPEELTNTQGLLMSQALCTAYHVCKKAQVKEGSVVAVFGCGSVGLLTQVVARKMGAGRVFGIDKVADRLAKAAEFGSEPLDCSAVNDIAAEILRLCPPGVNIAITAVGSRHPKSWTESLGVSASSEDNIAAICNAIRACRKGGVIAVAGEYQLSFKNFPIAEITQLDRTISGGLAHNQQYWAEIADDIQQGRLRNIESVFSHTYELNQIGEAYELLNKSEGIKPLIRVSDFA